MHHDNNGLHLTRTEARIAKTFLNKVGREDIANEYMPPLVGAEDKIGPIAARINLLMDRFAEKFGRPPVIEHTITDPNLAKAALQAFATEPKHRKISTIFGINRLAPESDLRQDAQKILK